MANKGFSLLELAVAMAILGLLVGGGLAVVNTVVAHQQRAETAEYLEQVRQAILVYANVNGGLPFADTDNNGMPDASALQGYLPYFALRVRQKDAWERQLKYRVNVGLTSYAKANNCTTLRDIINRTADLSAWAPKVWDADAASASNPFAVGVVIVSAGSKDADGDGDLFDAIYDAGPPAVGGSNVTGNPSLRHKPASGFDDMVSYIGAATLYDWMQCP